MESFFVRFKNALVLIALLLVQVLALAVQVHRPADPQHPDGAQVRLLRVWTMSAFSPWERASTASGHGLRSAWSNYLALRHVRDENAELQRQIADLRLQRAALAQDALEGHRLQALLHFQQQYLSKTVAAQVIGTSGSDGSRILTLNKGANDGLAPDMAVLTPDGIVGKLRDVGPGTSQLLLLSDPNAGAGVILQSTRTRSVAHGTVAGRVVLTNLAPDVRIKLGEIVLTSGGDQVFPRGLPVGTIESIVPDPEHQPYTRITLRTAANLNQLDEVLVVVGMSSTLGSQVEADLIADAAHPPASGGSSAPTDNRLPSIREDQGPVEANPNGSSPAAPPPAENSRDLLPHPQPVLHSDRYSPGTTPPATDLTPGGGPH